MFLVEITKLKDEQTPIAIHKKDDYNQALMHLHQIFSSAMANENVLSAAVLIVDELGAVYKNEYWKR